MPSEPAPLFVLRPPDRAPYTATLDRLTALVRAARVLRMGRLADKLAKASDAIAGVEIAVEKDVDALIERTKLVHAKREAVFLQKQTSLDQHMTDLAEFSKDLEEFGKNDRSGAGGISSGNPYAGTTPKI